MTINVIIQVRTGSSRLPGKVLKQLSDKNVIEHIEHIVHRINRCKNIDNIIIATTTNIEDNLLYDFCVKNNILIYRGSENNVLERYYQTALITNTNIIIRITGDCPLIDPMLIDEMINHFLKLQMDYYQMEYQNEITSAFPDGFDCEIFTFKILKDAFLNATLSTDKEHVTSYIKKNSNNNHKYKVKLDKEYKNLDLVSYFKSSLNTLEIITYDIVGLEADQIYLILLNIPSIHNLIKLIFIICFCCGIIINDLTIYSINS